MHADALGTRLREAFGDAVRGAHDTLRLRATTVAQVARLMTLAREHAFRVAVPGGALIPGPGIVSLDLEGLARFNEVDVASQTVHVEAGALVSSVEAHLRARGLTLGTTDPLDPREPVGAWLARGAPGARAHADDPVDQLVCGLEIVLADGTLLAIRPAPRRAVGPDLVPAFVGGRACLGVIVGAHLVARRATPRAEVAYRFATRDAAESARAWIRGHGVRPATTTISQDSHGAALQVRLEGSHALREACLATVDRVARERGGVPASVDEAHAPVPSVGAAPSDVVRALARALDPADVLGTRPPHGAPPE